MVREQALEIAKTNLVAKEAADFQEIWNNGPKVNEASFGYRHGWYTVGDFCFNREMITGEKYDDQGAWAYL